MILKKNFTKKRKVRFFGSPCIEEVEFSLLLWIGANPWLFRRFLVLSSSLAQLEELEWGLSVDDFCAGIHVDSNLLKTGWIQQLNLVCA